jgi:predicted alpha/beta hydrolase family esterase
MSTSSKTPKKTEEKKQKRLIIVHGWEGHPGEGWFPWLKTEMERKGWEVKVPAMPNSKEPKVHEWLPYLTQVVGKVDENTFMVGHSLGCVAIVKFLGSLPGKDSIGGAVLVAGFDNPLKYKELENFFSAPVNWEKAKNKCKKFVSIHSEDDDSVPVINSVKLKNNLGAEAIVVNGFRHFSGSDGVTSLPVVFQKLLEISK